MKSMCHLAATVSIQPCFSVNYTGLKELFKETLVNYFKISDKFFYYIFIKITKSAN